MERPLMVSGISDNPTVRLGSIHKGRVHLYRPALI